MASPWDLELLLWICKVGTVMFPYIHTVTLKINLLMYSCWWWCVGIEYSYMHTISVEFTVIFLRFSKVWYIVVH